MFNKIKQKVQLEKYFIRKIRKDREDLNFLSFLSMKLLLIVVALLTVGAENKWKRKNLENLFNEQSFEWLMPPEIALIDQGLGPNLYFFRKLKKQN